MAENPKSIPVSQIAYAQADGNLCPMGDGMLHERVIGSNKRQLNMTKYYYSLIKFFNLIRNALSIILISYALYTGTTLLVQCSLRLKIQICQHSTLTHWSTQYHTDMESRLVNPLNTQVLAFLHTTFFNLYAYLLRALTHSYAVNHFRDFEDKKC